jgi:hypothetical protein
MATRLRPIVVEGRRYRWRFDERLVVIPEGRSGLQLRVEWSWVDWLEPDGPGPEPRVVTPRFVAAAIRFALGYGWDPDRNGPPLLLSYESDNFQVRRSDA